MAVGCGWTHTRGARGVGEGEAAWALLLDELTRGLDQRFAQIAVVIGAFGAAFPAHVKGVYIKAGGRNRRGICAKAACFTHPLFLRCPYLGESGGSQMHHGKVT